MEDLSIFNILASKGVPVVFTIPLTDRDFERYNCYRWVENCKITSLCGLIKHVAEFKMDSCYAVRLPIVVEGRTVFGDLEEDCRANIRLSGIKAEVSGYKSVVFSKKYSGICILGARSIHSVGREIRRASVIMYFDSKFCNDDLGRAVRKSVLSALGVDIARFASRKETTGHGTFCGLIGFLQDIMHGVISLEWLGRDADLRPPFVTKEIMGVINANKLPCNKDEEYGERYDITTIANTLRSRGVFGAPACNNSVKKGIKCPNLTVSPHTPSTYVIGGTIEAMLAVARKVIDELGV
ncbi:MAG: hypothetical protein DRN20_02095 [Thermoplasmata archaeon]|nr:MAG: hypothetical protein DRN20_02095 [Thermoplasmata archaeon]